MGMFDTLVANCPKCNTKNLFQSKGGDCILEFYDLSDCPDDVMSDANRHAPMPCEKCGISILVDIKNRKIITELSLKLNKILKL